MRTATALRPRSGPAAGELASVDVHRHRGSIHYGCQRKNSLFPQSPFSTPGVGTCAKRFVAVEAESPACLPFKTHSAARIVLRLGHIPIDRRGCCARVCLAQISRIMECYNRADPHVSVRIWDAENARPRARMLTFSMGSSLTSGAFHQPFGGEGSGPEFQG
jgi:hypothetical protein